MAEVIELAEVSVQVQDVSEAINFSHLQISQRLADVNSFSFIWRIEKEDAVLSDHVDFYKTNLGKEVTVTVDDGFVFKGVIQLINCYNQFAHNVEYEVTGKGLLMKLDEVLQCSSFVEQSLKDIFSSLGGNAAMKLNPKKTDKLFYTVQYNQTVFSFFCMMAARHGEWLYYTGEELVLGPPDTKAYELHMAAGNIYDLNLSARMQQRPVNTAGFDHYKGEAIASTKEAEKPGGSGMIDASIDASKNYYGSGQSAAHFTHSIKKEMLESFSEINQQSAASSSVYLTGRTYLSGLRLGGTIKILDEKDNSAGEYVIIELNHQCNSNTSYQNSFVAIPSEIKVPPYTNSQMYPYSKEQYAVVVNNEDKDGLSRVKVHFPWQKEGETTPWINVIVPHAGNGKGFRFLPEVDDEVIVGFIGNNAEMPFVLGAVYSEKNKPGVPESGNDVKMIGTRSGRRIIFDDKKKMVLITDNVFEKDEFNLEQTKTPNNMVVLVNGDGTDDPYVSMSSNKDDDNWSYIQFNNGKEMRLSMISGGQTITSLVFSKDGKKITMHSKGSINLQAEGELNIDATNINMTAQKKINVTAGDDASVTVGKNLAVAVAQSTSLDTGGDLAVTAGTNINMTAGQNIEMTAAVQGAMTAGALAKIEAGLVQIN